MDNEDALAVATVAVLAGIALNTHLVGFRRKVAANGIENVRSGLRSLGTTYRSGWDSFRGIASFDFENLLKSQGKVKSGSEKDSFGFYDSLAGRYGRLPRDRVSGDVDLRPWWVGPSYDGDLHGVDWMSPHSFDDYNRGL